MTFQVALTKGGPRRTPNLIANPNFETDTTGWGVGGTNTIARSTTQRKYSTHSLKCTYQDTVGLGYYGITLTAVAHTLGVWVYVPSDYDGDDLDFEFVNFAGMTGITNGVVNMALTDQWQFVVGYGTPVGGGLAGHIQMDQTGNAPTAGKFIYIDGVDCVPS